GNSCDVGAPCDDGDSNTFNDVFDANCDCAGTTCTVSVVQGLTAINVGSDFAELSWNEVPGANYKLQYRESGTNGLVGVDISIDNIVTLTGLSPNTTYQMRIRSECGDQVSNFSAVGSFTTTSDCPAEGLPCDDGNPNTENDLTDGNCGCAGTLIGDCNFTAIDTSDFETGFGIWNDGGDDCIRFANSNAANSGNFSILLRDNSASSVMTTNDLDLSSYVDVTVEFSFITRSMENGEDFLLELSTDGGATYSTVDSWVSGTDFSNFSREFEFVTIPGALSSTTRFRFRCDASANNDIVYIDDVIIGGCAVSNPNNEESLLGDGFNNISANHKTPTTTLSVINDLRLAPNPTRDFLMVNLQLATSDDLQVLVTNLAGQSILQKVISADTGNFNFELNTSQYKPGLYLLTVRTAQQQLSQKFVVIE
ncbi:MAG: T9SS type A sorting domain-containing protein, partial [Bacteroidota bacterium]